MRTDILLSLSFWSRGGWGYYIPSKNVTKYVGLTQADTDCALSNIILKSQICEN